jgi:hypothetical protein
MVRVGGGGVGGDYRPAPSSANHGHAGDAAAEARGRDRRGRDIGVGAGGIDPAGAVGRGPGEGGPAAESVMIR